MKTKNQHKVPARADRSKPHHNLPEGALPAEARKPFEAPTVCHEAGLVDGTTSGYTFS